MAVLTVFVYKFCVLHCMFVCDFTITFPLCFQKKYEIWDKDTFCGRILLQWTCSFHFFLWQCTVWAHTHIRLVL